MRRVISLWLPRFATDRLTRAKPAWRNRPLALVLEARMRLGLTAVNRAAEAAGLRPGMALADARALVPGLVVAPAHPPRDAKVLDELAAWCGRYSPWIAIDAAVNTCGPGAGGGGSSGGGGLWLDATGCAHLFGGEEAMLSELTDRIGALGFAARAAIADTPGAAWAVARFAAAPERWIVVAPGPDELRAALAPLPVAALRIDSATAAVLAWPGPLGQIAAILLGGALGWLVLDKGEGAPPQALNHGVSRPLAVVCLVLFALLLALLPLGAAMIDARPLALVDSFYRSGALVFGGGHVILPLLQAEVVPPGWIDRDAFLAGYGAAQALPGPLLTFSAYLGAMIDPRWAGLPVALLCLVAVFAPSFLLVIGMLPFWDALRRFGAAQAAMAGINAAVVGLLLAALYDPVWTGAIHAPQDFALAVVAYVALAWAKLPPWLVVIACGLAGALISGWSG